MNILITGGAGFIGQKVARSLLKENFNVRILDNFSPQIHSINSLPKDLEKNVELIRGDIRNRSILKTSLGGIDKVIPVHNSCILSLCTSIATGIFPLDITINLS